MIISRKAEAELPDFSSHEQARTYFKNKYGERFILTGTEIIGEDRIYFYSLIIVPKDFKDGQEKLSQGGIDNALDFLNSYQPIEIWEDGRIHIIH